MIEVEVSIKTVAEVDNNTGNFLITCFSDKNEDGTTVPSIFKSHLPNSHMTIDNVEVKEGELALSYEGDGVGELVNGELVITPYEDDANKYSIQDQNLIYTEENG